MKIFISSPYVRLEHVNTQIVNALRNELKIDVFLPKAINVDAVSMAEMKYVADICYSQIDQREIIILVGPFGLSVAAEIGYVIARKREGKKKYIVFYCSESKDSGVIEAMIDPFIDFKVGSIKDLVASIKELLEEETPNNLR